MADEQNDNIDIDGILDRIAREGAEEAPGNEPVSNVITLPEGKRLRLAGVSYVVTDETDVPADLAPAVQQKNRHYKVACFNPTCVAIQKANKRRAIAYRGAREVFAQGLPTCGVCGGEYPDGSKHTMEPDGWSLDAE